MRKMFQNQCEISFLFYLGGWTPCKFTINTLPGVEPDNAENGPMMEHWAEEMGLGAGLQVKSRFQLAT